MRKIKIFSDGSTTHLTNDVNKWLVEHPVPIIFNVLQSQSECHTDTEGWSHMLTITIFYYEAEGA